VQNGLEALARRADLICKASAASFKDLPSIRASHSRISAAVRRNSVAQEDCRVEDGQSKSVTRSMP